MTTRPASELLYDSEAALRLVDSAIEEIRAPEARGTARADHPEHAGRARDVFATANIRSGLERSLALVEKLDARPAGAEPAETSGIRRLLRDELLALLTFVHDEDAAPDSLMLRGR
jgi:hypothetical protein